MEDQFKALLNGQLPKTAQQEEEFDSEDDLFSTNCSAQQ